MQLVSDCVIMYDTMKDKTIGVAEVIEKFGVPPEKVIEVQALIGDSTDNVPGVPGIGVKTAAQLIGEYGDLETLLARAGEIKQEKRRQTLIDNAEKARHVEEAGHARRQREARRAARRPRGARAGLQAADRLPQGDGIQLADAPRRGILRHRCRARSSRTPAASRRPPRAAPATAERSKRPSRGAAAAQLALDRRRQPAPLPRQARPRRRRRRARRRRRWPRRAREAARSAKVDRARYEIVRTSSGSRPGSRARASSARSRIDTETTSLDPMQAELCGISLAVAPNEACYVPLAHRKAATAAATACSRGDIVARPDSRSAPRSTALQAAAGRSAACSRSATTSNSTWQMFALRGIEIAPYDDTMLMSYVLDAGRASHGLDALAERYLRSRRRSTSTR